MELEEMKRQWDDMSTELAQQKIVNKNLIMEMTHDRFKSKISTIGKYERAGTLLCIPVAIFILFNIHKMDSGILLACAIFCITTLIIIPMKSLRLIGQMRQSVISDKNYKQSIIEFAKSRKSVSIITKIRRDLGYYLDAGHISSFQSHFRSMTLLSIVHFSGSEQ